MAQEGSPVSIAKACQLAGLPRRTFYYQSKRRERRINDALAVRIKRVIDTLPYAGYRTVAWLLGENKNTVQRIFQLKGWQVRKRRPEKVRKIIYTTLHHGLMSVGRPIWRAYGVVNSIAGAHSQWLWIAIPVNYSAGA